MKNFAQNISPAPWTATAKGIGNHLIIDANGEFVATTHAGTPAGNGPLVAAAPSLALALERIAEDLEYFAGEVPPSRAECRKLAEVARAAIARATP